MLRWTMREWSCGIAGFLAGVIVLVATQPSAWQPVHAFLMAGATTFALMRVTGD